MPPILPGALNLYQQARGRRDEFRNRQELLRTLQSIDGLAFGAYRELYGGWRLEGLDLFINHVPADHHGPPAHFVIWTALASLGFDPSFWDRRWKRVAAADFFLRAFREAIGPQPAGSRGSGMSGLLETDAPGQAVEERNACFVDSDALELRLVAGLPSAGMTILVDELQAMLRLLERAIEAALTPRPQVREALAAHIRTAEVQDALRAEALRRGLIAFVADGSLLPRRGGGSDLPADPGRAEAFTSPPSLHAELDLGPLGRYRGLGIPRGVTVITGGPYHGKSTLLRAIEEGVRNHVAGDGRELVVTHVRAVRTEAEEGRRVSQADLSPFLHHLPSHVDVSNFTSAFASGSTSQAANIVEAVGSGARLLLIDEDRAATNLMFADEGMRALMGSEDVTVTSFLERARELYETLGISSILVTGSSSRYFAVADVVLKLENYRCRDITAEAKAVAAEYHPEIISPSSPLSFSRRIPMPADEDLYQGRRFVDCMAEARGLVRLGRHEIDLSRLPSVWNPGQLTAAGIAVAYLSSCLADGHSSTDQLLDELERRLDEEGLTLLDPFRWHFLTRPSRFQISSALNRCPFARFFCAPA
ncbi:MAG: ABC-ATPase domain-containing protein [Planctomycetes bacterium]|nr:ABC-ATPase domain-containing protein [Planctomycetota bacterium]